VRPPGPLLASGRDADIFEYGEGLVLRRSRDGRSIASEAQTMEYLHAQGYPVPAVHEVSDDGTDLVMERIDGVSMVEAVGRAPWKVRQFGKLLASLHERLHALPAPDFLHPALVGRGDCIVHLDLHPLNVMIAESGPVVIDWTGASLGDPDIDVGLAWVLMAAGEIPDGGLKAKALGFGRSLLVNSFKSGIDVDRVSTKLRDVVTWKVNDPHMSPQEIAAMWRVVERAEAGR
jgi:aminoglycoside phosphotransferase (APT) family kinase protein